MLHDLSLRFYVDGKPVPQNRGAAVGVQVPVSVEIDNNHGQVALLSNLNLPANELVQVLCVFAYENNDLLCVGKPLPQCALYPFPPKPVLLAV